MSAGNGTGRGDIVVTNPWDKLRKFTLARIALGRAGVSLPTRPHLEFQLAHARARNAVHHELDVERLKAQLTAAGWPPQHLRSRAESRPIYLQRPDKGRRLDEPSREKLTSLRAGDSFDAAIVIGDGLSALAIEENVIPFLTALLPKLAQDGWRTAPLTIVTQARVAVGDEVGEILGARLVVMLIGERPGLSSPDSMGIYMTYGPRVGLTDESRNCISNVRPEGLSYEGAAYKLLYLMNEARRRGLSGVNLKDEAETLVADSGKPSRNFLLEQD
jgi:ethanolamine ammonia-lyase small subunit